MQSPATDSKAMLSEVDDLLNTVASSMDQVKKAMDESGADVSVEMIEAEIKAQQARQEAEQEGADGQDSPAVADEPTPRPQPDASQTTETEQDQSPQVGADSSSSMAEMEKQPVSNPGVESAPGSQEQTTIDPDLRDPAGDAPAGAVDASSPAPGEPEREGASQEDEPANDEALAELDEAIARNAEAALEDEEETDEPPFAAAASSEPSSGDDECAADCDAGTDPEGASTGSEREKPGRCESAAAETAIAEARPEVAEPALLVRPSARATHPTSAEENGKADSASGLATQLISALGRLWSRVPCQDLPARAVWASCVRINEPWNTWSRETQMVVSLVATFTGFLGLLAIAIALARIL